MVKFKVFTADETVLLEKAVNEWLSQLETPNIVHSNLLYREKRPSNTLILVVFYTVSPREHS